MRLARKVDASGQKDIFPTIHSAFDREPRTIKSVTKANKLKALFDVVDKVNVTRLADERQSRDDEIKLHRDMAAQLIDTPPAWRSAPSRCKNKKTAPPLAREAEFPKGEKPQRAYRVRSPTPREHARHAAARAHR
jgi:hypothetical protein